MTVYRLLNSPVAGVTPEQHARAVAFADAKGKTNDYRAKAERAAALHRSRVEGVCAEFYVASILGGEVDTEVHGGSHGADVGKWQVKTCDFDRWTPDRRSLMLYPESFRDLSAPILFVAKRNDPLRFRALYALTYGDAGDLGREPFTRVGRERGAIAVYARDLFASSTPIEFEEWVALHVGS